MKKLFAALFFTADPARGTVFALTLLTLGNFLWISFFFMAMLATERASLLFWVKLWAKCADGVFLFGLYALTLGILGLARLAQVLRERRTRRPLWWLVPAGVCLAAGCIGIVQACFALVFALKSIYDDCDSSPWLSDHFSVLSLTGWAAIFVLSLVLLLTAGLMLAAMLAAAEKRRFRSLFGKATLALWGLLAVWYAVTLGMALHESREAAAVREAVERRFDRPLTAAGLEALYCESGATDADYWEHEEACRDALPDIETSVKEENDASAPDDGEITHPVRKQAFYDIHLPDRPTAETLAWYGRLCREHRAAIEAWGVCFDRVPPLPVREFSPGFLKSMGFPEYTSCRDFAQMERSRLILALALGDADAAWACYRRMGNAAAFLRKEPFLIGHLVWINIEYRRLDGVEKMLESRLFSDARLDELAADLAELESAIPRIHQQAMYGEAVFQEDILHKKFFLWLEKSFAPYRWIFPQFWYGAALAKKAMLQDFLLPDFTCFPPWSDREQFFSLFAILRLDMMDRTGNLFYALTARTRGMQILLRAERYRRAHGAFPPTLDDLPEDPFTGKALIYEVGPAEIEEWVWEEPVSSSEKWVKTAVEAAQVRSDPAKTLEKRLRDPEKGSDRTRAAIRLWNGTTNQAPSK